MDLSFLVTEFSPQSHILSTALLLLCKTFMHQGDISAHGSREPHKQPVFIDSRERCLSALPEQVQTQKRSKSVAEKELKSLAPD